jgi:hypothetical protein
MRAPDLRRFAWRDEQRRAQRGVTIRAIDSTAVDDGSRVMIETRPPAALRPKRHLVPFDIDGEVEDIGTRFGGRLQKL